MKSVKNFLRVFFRLLGSLTALLLLWGVCIEPRLIDTESFEVRIPNLPKVWNGKEIAFISDLQYGMWLNNPSAAEKAIQKILEQKPALVLLGGDFIYHPVEDDSLVEAIAEFKQEEKAEVDSLIKEVVATLAPLENSKIPTFAVLGNHDYGMEKPKVLKLSGVAKQLTKSLEAAGIEVLENEAQKVYLDSAPNHDPLYIVGIGPRYPNEANIEKAFASLDHEKPRVVFTHNPQTFPNIPAKKAPLAIAGHTHGGQIRIPFFPRWSWMDWMKSHDVKADGWIKSFGNPGNKLYVNRGIGFSRYPIRVNCLPEITFFRLSS